MKHKTLTQSMACCAAALCDRLVAGISGRIQPSISLSNTARVPVRKIANSNQPRDLGIWTIGLAAMAMLVALISGIVIHKKFFKDFFTFRPAKGQRSWLDAHNATAVLVLPFHLMITYTGLVIFYLIYMPAAGAPRSARPRLSRSPSNSASTTQDAATRGSRRARCWAIASN